MAMWGRGAWPIRSNWVTPKRLTGKDRWADKDDSLTVLLNDWFFTQAVSCCCGDGLEFLCCDDDPCNPAEPYYYLNFTFSGFGGACTPFNGTFQLVFEGCVFDSNLNAYVPYWKLNLGGGFSMEFKIEKVFGPGFYYFTFKGPSITVVYRLAWPGTWNCINTLIIPLFSNSGCSSAPSSVSLLLSQSTKTHFDCCCNQILSTTLFLTTTGTPCTEMRFNGRQLIYSFQGPATGWWTLRNQTGILFRCEETNPPSYQLRHICNNVQTTITPIIPATSCSPFLWQGTLNIPTNACCPGGSTVPCVITDT